MKISEQKIKKVTKKSDIINFGKFSGTTVKHILSVEASYILWLDEKEIVEFPEDIIEEAIELADDQRNEYLRDNYGSGEYPDDWGDK